jgi:hypothetical protein
MYIGWPELATAALVAGCVSLTSAESATLADLQAFADATGRFYKRGEVHVAAVEEVQPGAAGAYYGGHGLIVVPKALLRAPPRIRDVVLAHELAHWLLGHGHMHSETARQANERDANEIAIVILMQVRSLPEREALARVYGYLADVAGNQAEKKSAPLAGHGHPCEEIAHLIMRFPRYSLALPRWCP